MGEKRKKNSKLLYFSNRTAIFKYFYIAHCIAWLFCILFSLIYTITQPNSGFLEKIQVDDGSGAPSEITIFRLNVAFLPIIGMEFIVPIVYRICEAWSNAVMFELFNQLLKKNEIIFTDSEAATSQKKKDKLRSSLRSSRGHHNSNSVTSRCSSWFCFSCCKCCRSKNKSKKKKQSKKDKRIRFDFKENDTSFKEEKSKDEKVKIGDYQFKHRNFYSNRKYFWYYMKSGCD